MFWLPLSEEKRLILADDPVVVIMSRGHSGTRVLSRMCESLGVNLGGNEDLQTGDTADLRFTRSIKKIALHDIACCLNTKESCKTWLQNRFDRAAWGYRERLNPRELWGWKFPETYLIGPYVENTFPKAKYIHLVRDGRDIAFKNHLTDDPHRQLGRVLLEHIGALNEPHHIQAALSWEYQVRGWQSFEKSLPRGRVIDLRFEDLLANPSAAATQLTSFLEIPITPECEEYLATELDLSKSRQHKENDPAQVTEVEERIAASLRDFKYLK